MAFVPYSREIGLRSPGRHKLITLERDPQVRLDDGRDVPRPDHGSMGTEVDYLAIGDRERVISAGVSACPYLKDMVSWLKRRLDRLVAFD